MNVEIGAEAAQFPEKEYVNGIAVAVQASQFLKLNNLFSKGKKSAIKFCKSQISDFADIIN
jgi:hypothetical protein